MLKEKHKGRRKVILKILCFGVSTMIFFGIVAALFYNGILLFNTGH